MTAVRSRSLGLQAALTGWLPQEAKRMAVRV
jgi:hypothetical protein